MKRKIIALLLLLAAFFPAKADEGMWLLQLMQEQNLAERMKAQGLKIGCCWHFWKRMYRRNYFSRWIDSD